MFEKSGMSIAMGNATPEVQAQANFVSSSNNDEGFAQGRGQIHPQPRSLRTKTSSLMNDIDVAT